jgi:hypothetical protein
VTQSDTAPTALSLDEVRALADAIRAQVAKAVVGQDEVVDHLLVALLAGGTSCSKGRRARPRLWWRKALPRRWGSISGASSSPPI